jgi:methionyl-tRNA formyltransferase
MTTLTPALTLASTPTSASAVADDSRQPSVIFMGTPDFAVASLRAVHERYAVRAVVTVPDKPKGRGLQVQSSPVKLAAQELGIETILQPDSLKSPEFRAALEALKPDVMVVVAFRILPREIYSLARLGAFNVHASLLPKYRGAAPINWAIIEGERETGVTSFLLADGVDTGQMLGRSTIAIAEGTTAGELHDALMPLAATLAAETASNLIRGSANPKPQDDTAATKAPKIFRETCAIDWTQPARCVRDFIHGMSPHPGAWTLVSTGAGSTVAQAIPQAIPQAISQTVMKILRVTLDTTSETSETRAGEAGTYSIEAGVWRVRCGDGNVVVLAEIQPEGKRVMAASEYLRGFRGAAQGRFA